MNLAETVQRLLCVSEDYFSALFEASDLDVDDFSDAFLVILYVFDAFVILDDPTDSKVDTAEDNFFLDVFDESQYLGVNFESVYIYKISVNEPVTNALPSIAQDFMVQFCGALVDLPAFSHVVHDLLVEDIQLSHFLVYLWQVLDVLGRILDH